MSAEPTVKLGSAIATGWFAKDLLEARRVVATWSDTIKPPSRETIRRRAESNRA